MAANLGDQIRGLRLKKHWTQDDLAEKVGVTREAVSYWELNRRTPAIGTLEKIAQVLGVSVADLLERPVAPLGEPPEDPQRWEHAFASVRERQSNVTAKVNELVETSTHSGEVDLHQVKRALDEAQGFQFTLMRAMSGVSLRHSRGRVEMAFNPFAPEFDPAQWDEVGNAMGFYADIVDRLVKAGLAERLVESGLAEWKERAGQKRELVPVGIGE
jgi:transcriptional regulator with XRE-family HTH domain